MSDPSIGTGALAGLAGSWAGVVLVAKWTLLLGLAWLVHAALARCNPRWRVALWRTSIVGVAIIALLAMTPPLVRYQIAVEPPRSPVDRAEPPVTPRVADRPAIAAPAYPPAAAPWITRPDGKAAAPSPIGRPDLSVASVDQTSTLPTAPAPAAPAAVEPWLTYLPRQARAWARWIWLAGALVLALRLGLAALALHRLVHRAVDAPEDVVRQCRAISERLGCRGHVRIVCSPDVPTPCLAGVLRPVLLLPRREVLDLAARCRDDLPAILAHELAHARHHDLAWNLAAHLAEIALWFHPLAWRIRSAHVAACDAVSDAVAADFLGDVASYGRTLARLAVAASSPAPAHVLAMARTSEVWRRLDALNRHVFGTPLSRRLIMPALGIASLVLVLIGGFGVTRAGQEAPKPAPPAREPAKAAPAQQARPAAPAEGKAKARSGRLELKAVDAATGEPIEAVSIEYQVRLAGKFHRATIMTGEEGTAAIEWEPGAQVKSLWVTARKPKLVPIHILWSNEQRPIQLPAVKELRMQPGTTAGGIVKDAAGQPIAGAEVSIFLYATESDRAHYGFHLAQLRTDAQGRWRVEEAPRDMAGIYVNVSHPKFRRGGGPLSPDLNSVVVLKKGISVPGRVVDREGRPVSGARVVMGHDQWGTNPPTAHTSDQGAFTLENCDAGRTIITVQASGFAPQIHDVTVLEATEPVEVRLTEPAATIRGRVVDVQGKPVAGAFAAADTWRGHRSIEFRVNTDRDGRFEWKGAPRDVVRFDFGHEGYMASRQIPLTASDREQNVTLYPVLVITGRVTDAATGRPVERFRVVRGRRFEGQKEPYWSENEAVPGTHGQFVSRFDEPGAALFIRVEAPGFKPADSRPILPSEGTPSIDFALQPAVGLTGVVQLPDGSPAEGAEVALATRTNHVSLQAGRFDRNANVPRFTTGPDGRFTFTPPDDKYLLIAVSDAGYADATSDAFAKAGKLVLQSWGRIEGGVRIGVRAAADQEVTFQPIRPDQGGGMYVFNYGYTTKTDQRGRFAFDRVVPGPGSVSRSVITAFAGGREMHTPGWNEAVEVKPGETLQVKIGGKGRPVVGRVVLDGTPELPVDWTVSDPATITTPRAEWTSATAVYPRYAASIERDGRFRIDDVPAGQYELDIPVNTVPDPAFCGSGARIGETLVKVTVPEVPGGRSNEPLDLGTVTAKLFETIKAGDLAPDFVVQRLSTGDKDQTDRLKLSDSQGKLVLLEFWATWCGPCLTEMPAFRDIQETFGRNARFKLIGLACDQQPETAEEYLHRNPMSWTQGFAGHFSSSVGESYKLRMIPATFLIGPDGRILAKNLRGPALKEAVAKALNDKSLFGATAWLPRPGRFPVTHVNTAAALSGSIAADPPLAVVLDDCDADLQETRPHHDAVRLLRAASGGKPGTLGTSSIAEFHTCQTSGGTQEVAIDRERGRIYFTEKVAQRVVALDLSGRKVWHVGGISAESLAIDPKTGNVWCTVGRDLASGETVVLDPAGREVTSHPVRGSDIAYDPHTDTFWLAGYMHNGITRLSREGKVLFHKPCEGFSFASVAVDPRDGSVWVVERAHPDVAKSTNRLWHLDSAGTVIKVWPMDEQGTFGVACDPKTGTAWVVVYHQKILRFTADGSELPALSIPAVAVAVSPTTGRAWATTQTEVIELDSDGHPAARSPIGPKSEQSWIAAY